MGLRLAQLAQQLDVELRGDGDVLISAAASLQRAGPDALSFIADARHRKALLQTKAGAVVAAPGDADRSPAPVLVSENPLACFARALGLLFPEPGQQAGVDASAVVDTGASIDATAWIGPHSVIGNGAVIGPGVQIGPGCIVGNGVRIGRNSRLTARVTVLADARIGDRVVLHPGSVIGADGFGNAWVEDHWEKVPQIGSVVIGNDVEIGANTTVDRGSLGDTVIGDGVRIDNLAQIAHNVHIGAHSALAGCVGISGSARIGAYCTLAGGVGLVGHIELADHVHITGMSMVTRSISRPGTYSAGTPLMPNVQWRRNAVRMKRLDELYSRLTLLEAETKRKINETE